MIPTLQFQLRCGIQLALGVPLASHYPIQVEIIDGPLSLVRVKKYMGVLLVGPPGGARNSVAPVQGGDNAKCG